MSMAATLEEGIAALGLDLPTQAQEKLLAFARLLIKWNKVYNLTAIRDEAQVVTHHLLDSLSVLPQLALAHVHEGGERPGLANEMAVLRQAMRAQRLHDLVALCRAHLQHHAQLFTEQRLERQLLAPGADLQAPVFGISHFHAAFAMPIFVRSCTI